MGRFIEVYRSNRAYPMLVNVDKIEFVKQINVNRQAVLVFRDESEMIIEHTYNEVKDALFLMGENQPVFPVSQGELKDEK